MTTTGPPRQSLKARRLPVQTPDCLSLLNTLSLRAARAVTGVSPAGWTVASTMKDDPSAVFLFNSFRVPCPSV
ncbi:hypothetical protein BaRGS_00024335 [Batillaria attramentaria]|uniref:Uncharacterized protein n=1 Tax=Batillaria attramentaria TaxID=370345 RepID=A0ABD0KBG9_9CAEN